MISKPLHITVAGHTNTGKTSLLRTLTRDARFGEVSDRPGTTRHVEAARLLVDGKVLLELYDTPGIEESIDLLALLEEQAASNDSREDGPSRIRRFLDSAPAKDRFEQEAKVLRQLLRSDAAFYVLDARDPVLAKHRDELEILRLCGVPLLPLLNFSADPAARETVWREALAGLGLHAIVRFDTVAPAEDGERLLYEKLASLLDPHRDLLNKLIQNHAEEARLRQLAAMEQIADLLIGVAALRERVSTMNADSLEKGVELLNRTVRAREQACVERLLSLYRFYPDDVETAALPLVDGRWQMDAFDPLLLQTMGVRVGGGAAAGAAAGAGIDLMVGGLTLGAAAAIGALLGGGLQTLRHYGSGLLGKLTGEKSLRVDDSILLVLASRQCELILALERRGHAAQQRAVSSRELLPLFPENVLPAAIRLARANPSWAQDKSASFGDEGREDAVVTLSHDLDTGMSTLRQR
ncbi:MAG: DUF3482 domain-containing protein [Pseudohongiella sp.]|nr:DUF3482 domain-containing protein [Pseudohongiella sp.]